MVNAFWAAVETHGVRAETVIALSTKSCKAAVESTLPSLKIIAGEFGIEPRFEHKVVPEDDLGEAHWRIRSLLRDWGGHGEIILDITPARKRLAAVALHAASAEGISRILYLYLRQLEAGDRPLALIPRTLRVASDLGAMHP